LHAPELFTNCGLLRGGWRGLVSRFDGDQKTRGRYLGGKVPFGFRIGADGELVEVPAEQEAIREMVALRTQGTSLRPSRGRRAAGSATGAWRAC